MYFFALNIFEDVESKTFIVRLSFERDNFRRLRGLGLLAVVRQKPERPAAPGKRLRPNAAPPGGILWQGEGCRVLALKRSRGGCQRHLWPGASEAGPEIPSPTWGTSKKLFRIEIHEKKVCICSKCLEQVVTFHPKKFHDTFMTDSLHFRGTFLFSHLRICHESAVKVTWGKCHESANLHEIYMSDSWRIHRRFMALSW